MLVEKPVAHDYRDTLRARDLAAAKGLKTKVGFTFRYSPAVRYMKELIDEGFVGTPYIYNAYEQNSQWIDPQTPLRQVAPDPEAIGSSSRRSRATAPRSSTSGTGSWPPTSRRSSASFATSCPSG